MTREDGSVDHRGDESVAERGDKTEEQAVSEGPDGMHHPAGTIGTPKRSGADRPLSTHLKRGFIPWNITRSEPSADVNWTGCCEAGRGNLIPVMREFATHKLARRFFLIMVPCGFASINDQGTRCCNGKRRAAALQGSSRAAHVALPPFGRVSPTGTGLPARAAAASATAGTGRRLLSAGGVASFDWLRLVGRTCKGQCGIASADVRSLFRVSATGSPLKLSSLKQKR